QITHVPLSLNCHTKASLPCFITKLDQYPMILGESWLEQHDPGIRRISNSMTFGRSQHCRAYCLPAHTCSLLIHVVVPKR
ncbi:hypothetical protein BJ878DRAFT_387733, partial [Calycina marina]